MLSSANKLGPSYALGFWVKHTLAMDELYEAYAPDGAQSGDEVELDANLRAVWNNQEYREKLEQVFRAGELDRDILMAAAAKELETAFGRNGSPMRVLPRGTRDPWVKGFYLEPVRGKFTGKKLWLTVTLGDGDVNDQILRTSVWGKGGRATGRLFTSTFAGAVEGVDFVHEGWSSGAVVLSRIKLSEYLDPTTNAIDLDRVLDRLIIDLREQTNEVLNAVVSALRG